MATFLDEMLERCRSTARAATESVRDLAFPPCCRFCQRLVASNQDFCRSCRVGLTASEPQMRCGCGRCGWPLGRMPAEETRLPTECPQCKDQSFHFDRVIPMWMYQGMVCDAVVAAKYFSQSSLADTLGRRLGGIVSERLAEDRVDAVTFVPSHFTRQLSRGGIGVQTLATAVAKRMGTPCKSLLKATRRIAKQAWLDDASRVHNVRDAFRLKKSYAFGSSPDLCHRHILLVDDVFTTGATTNEVARVLRSGGVSKVSVAVVARSVRSAHSSPGPQRFQDATAPKRERIRNRSRDARTG
ncbi:ComF family protein [Novipirellula artificiosorum]|uniref:DNA utilization protein GntX n=1 Tax=Novipirellula artificiosorum TaxID=2528016 RepID=A0A5C6DA58_9BACT|nr:phosphoribosyltransferase family protein [Novipirellula artificiosorum]TWU33015.1 DNA utilization protein GntX [Novipirellula artificiosorum]